MLKSHSHTGNALLKHLISNVLGAEKTRIERQIKINVIIDRKRRIFGATHAHIEMRRGTFNGTPVATNRRVPLCRAYSLIDSTVVAYWVAFRYDWQIG